MDVAASLPVIDLSLADETVAGAMDRACRDTGFFLIANHGVDPGLQGRLDRAARRFFALPEEAKAELAMVRGGRTWRGWFPEGGELTSGRPDHKEGLYLGTDLAADDPRVLAGVPLHGPNLLPDDSVPELRLLIDEWMASMAGLGHRLLGHIAQGLGLEQDWFQRNLTADPTLLFRIFRYPPRRGTASDSGGWGVGEHTDYGLLTILAHDGSPGLQVRVGSGDALDWIDVPSVPGTFVVNIGDMLDRLTGGRYRSTPHRVRPDRDRSADRLSFPFFFDPSWDARVVSPPLGGEAPPDDADSRWDGTSVHGWEGTYGQYLTAKVARVFPDLGLELGPTP